MRNLIYSLILLLLFVPSLVSGQALSPLYSAEVNILHSSPADIQINPNAYLMKGETLTVSVSGRVNLNHENFEVRRCKYFGMKCWYEWRSRSHWKEAPHFKIAYTLVDLSGNEVQPKRIESLGSSFEIAYPTSDRQGISDPLRIKAYIVRDDIHRIECKGRPRYCSAGALTMKVTSSNVDKRMKELEELLASYKENPSAIDTVYLQSSLVMDPFLLDNKTKRDDVQQLFAKKMSEWTVDVRNGRSVVDLAKFAASMSNNKESIQKLNTLIMNGHLARGDYSKVVQEGRSLMQTAKDKCEGDYKDFTACNEYITQLKLNATAWTEQRARYSSNEIRVAIGFQETALEVAKSVKAKNKDMKPDLIFSLRRNVANISYDVAQMLLILRTRPEIDRAVNFLATAKSCIVNDLKGDDPCPV